MHRHRQGFSSADLLVSVLLLTAVLFMVHAITESCQETVGRGVIVYDDPMVESVYFVHVPVFEWRVVGGVRRRVRVTKRVRRMQRVRRSIAIKNKYAYSYKGKRYQPGTKTYKSVWLKTIPRSRYRSQRNRYRAASHQASRRHRSQARSRSSWWGRSSSNSNQYRSISRSSYRSSRSYSSHSSGRR